MGQKFLLNGRVELRFDDKNKFDELYVAERNGGLASIHFEMMDDNTLWIGLRPAGCDDEVHVTVSARGRLDVVAREA